MQIINLCYKNEGNVGYEIVRFPDGQVHFKLTGTLNHKDGVKIETRITDAEELFILLQVLDVCNRHGISPRVNIWYLMGARMDRVMSFNEPFTLRIIQNMLGGYDAEYVVLEPHNIEETCRNPKWHTWTSGFVTIGKVVCFPDNGALARYGISRNGIVCRKKRDLENGKLSGFELDLKGFDIAGKDVLVLDDLCDGGGTFCGIIPLIREHSPKSVSLYVTHAIQKSGIERVSELYDKVYITNSYKDWEKENLPDNVIVGMVKF